MWRKKDSYFFLIKREQKDFLNIYESRTTGGEIIEKKVAIPLSIFYTILLIF